MATDTTRAKRLYPPYTSDTEICYPYDYDPMIADFGEVLVKVSDDDYTGDTRVLLRKNGRYGFLDFGWGSCSGCDALQACANYATLAAFIDEMEQSIKWFDSISEAKAYICDNEQRENSYYYHTRTWADFVRKVSTFTEED